MSQLRFPLKDYLDDPVDEATLRRSRRANPGRSFLLFLSALPRWGSPLQHSRSFIFTVTQAHSCLRTVANLRRSQQAIRHVKCDSRTARAFGSGRGRTSHRSKARVLRFLPSSLMGARTLKCNRVGRGTGRSSAALPRLKSWALRLPAIARPIICA
jgi:hypothetical protein